MVARFRVETLLQIKGFFMTEFEIKNMSCGHCVGAITKTVKQLDPGATVETDLANKTVKIESGQSREDLAAALAEAGYPPAPSGA